MNFEKALEAMKQGKKVKRMSWDDGSYICFNSAGEIVDENGWLLLLLLEIAKSGSWEIYEEPQKEPEMTAEHAIENLERDTEPEHKCNACHCNCSHTGADTNLREEMKQALSRKFFELEKYSDEESTVNSMLNIYNSIFSD